MIKDVYRKTGYERLFWDDVVNENLIHITRKQLLHCARIMLYMVFIKRIIIRNPICKLNVNRMSVRVVKVGDDRFNMIGVSLYKRSDAQMLGGMGLSFPVQLVCLPKQVCDD